MGALARLGGLAFGRDADAATVYTYSFVQPGYAVSLGGGSSFPGTLAGGFTGTADATGHIDLSTLSDFHLTFGTPTLDDIYGSYSGLPDYFSYLVGEAEGGTLSFRSPLPTFYLPSAHVCLGSAVPVLCNGELWRGVVSFASDVEFVAEATDMGPTVTLVSAVTPTPIPGSVLLFATALAGLGAAGAWRRKAAAA